MESRQDHGSHGGIRDVGESGPVGSQALEPAEAAIDALLFEAHLAGGHDLPELVARHAAHLGCDDAIVYLTDLQQLVLTPFLRARPGHAEHHGVLGIDSTVAGRAYQLLQLQTQDWRSDHGHGPKRTRVWLPLVNGVERLGVLAVTIEDASLLAADDRVLLTRVQRFASLVAQLVMTKTLYGDSIVRLRRTSRMGLAAEMQWSLLPPLTYASPTVTVAAGMEPAYDVAGDSFDYAVDADDTRIAVFDGMGHGLASAQLTSLAVAAYRNARRAGLSLTQTAQHIDTAVAEMFTEAFATGLLGHLDTVTGIFTWLSAGHLEPLVLRGGRVVKTLEVEPMLPFGLSRALTGAPSGASSGMSAGPSLGSEHLQPGDLLLLYTDGVTEARSPEGHFFGLERLLDLVVRNLAAGLPAPETMRRVVRALLEHQSGDLADDATLVLVQWHGPAESGLAP